MASGSSNQAGNSLPGKHYLEYRPPGLPDLKFEYKDQAVKPFVTDSRRPYIDAFLCYAFGPQLTHDMIEKRRDSVRERMAEMGFGKGYLAVDAEWFEFGVDRSHWSHCFSETPAADSPRWPWKGAPAKNQAGGGSTWYAEWVQKKLATEAEDQEADTETPQGVQLPTVSVSETLPTGPGHLAIEASATATGQPEGHQGIMAAQDTSQSADLTGLDVALTDAEQPLVEAMAKALKPQLRDDQKDVVFGPEKPVYNATWTKQMERDLRAEDDVREALLALQSVGGGPKMLALWKVCGRVWHCSPLSLISPINGLKYDPGAWTGIEQESNHAVWSREFCEALTGILAHPVWCDDVDGLVTVIQFAVICRTGDERQWALPGRGGACPVLNELHLKPLAGPVQVRRALKYLRKRLGMMGSLASELLYCLAEAVKKREDPMESEPWHQRRVYGVTAMDLKNVARAIDAAPALLPTSVAYQAFLAARNMNSDMPNGVESLRDLYTRSWMHERRRLAVWIGEGEQESETPNDSGDGGSGDEVSSKKTASLAQKRKAP